MCQLLNLYQARRLPHSLRHDERIAQQQTHRAIQHARHLVAKVVVVARILRRLLRRDEPLLRTVRVEHALAGALFARINQYNLL